MTVSIVDMKVCSKCGTEQALSDFQKNKARYDGVEVYCRECNNARHRAKYAANPSKEIARTRRYHLEHPEWSKRTQFNWHQSNKERRYAKVKERYNSDPEFCEYRRKVGTHASHVRRARLANVETEKISIKQYDQILRTFNNQCWICDVELDIVFWDHVHPLSKDGAHVRSNLRPACKNCNSRKGSIHPFTEEMKIRIANDVRALRTPQGHTIPVRDGLEV